MRLKDDVGRELARRQAVDFYDTGQAVKKITGTWRGSSTNTARHISEGRRPMFVGYSAGFYWSFVNYYFARLAGENPCVNVLNSQNP